VNSAASTSNNDVIQQTQISLDSSLNLLLTSSGMGFTISRSH